MGWPRRTPIPASACSTTRSTTTDTPLRGTKADRCLSTAANQLGALEAFMAKTMLIEALVSLPGSSWSRVPPSQSATHADAAHRAGRRSLAWLPERGRTAMATTAYRRADPGAPVTKLGAPPKRPPRPSPRYQTDNAHTTEAGRAQRTVRGCRMPRPRASWMHPKLMLIRG